MISLTFTIFWSHFLVVGTSLPNRQQLHKQASNPFSKVVLLYPTTKLPAGISLVCVELPHLCPLVRLRFNPKLSNKSLRSRCANSDDAMHHEIHASLLLSNSSHEGVIQRTPDLVLQPSVNKRFGRELSDGLDHGGKRTGRVWPHRTLFDLFCSHLGRGCGMCVCV